MAEEGFLTVRCQKPGAAVVILRHVLTADQTLSLRNSGATALLLAQASANQGLG